MSKKDDGLRQRLLSEARGIRTVDSHSHTYPRRVYYEKGPFDLFSLMHYFERDIASAMGTTAIYKGTKTDEERWLRLRVVLEKSRNVSYWRHNLIVYQMLFGLKDAELTDQNWELVNESIRQKSQDPFWYDHVTDMCKLETQVRNIPWFEDWDKKYFTAVLRMEKALELHEKQVREQLESYLDISIDSLKIAKQAIANLVERYVRQGAIGIKLSHAYNRTLRSLPVEQDKAARIFENVLRGESLSVQEVRELQDYIIFYLAELAQEMKLVFQIHTGVQGNWGDIPDSDPLLLIPLLKSFPKVRFDLFHAGYPYSRMIGMLGKHYPNVWLNMAWMYVVSINASRQILSEWIDLVPRYRIIGFGSDVHFPEMIYGHLEMARSCLADVLAAKVRSDFLSEEEALHLVRRMFRDNAMELYGLNK